MEHQCCYFISLTKSQFKVLNGIASMRQCHWGPCNLMHYLVKRPKYRAITPLTLNAPITSKVVCFSHLLKCLRSLYGIQCGPRSDCSYRSSLFWVHTVCFLLNSSVMLGNYLQQTTSADGIFRCIFFLALLQSRRLFCEQTIVCTWFWKRVNLSIIEICKPLLLAELYSLVSVYSTTQIHGLGRLSSCQ